MRAEPTNWGTFTRPICSATCSPDSTNAGISKDQAIRWGALSSLGVTGLIEVGDAFSDRYGFSYQDMLFNTLGVTAGYLLWSFPDLSRKIDLRVEYNPFTERRLPVGTSPLITSVSAI